MKNNKGVTLVELLVVIVVMGIIAGFAIPAVGNIIENANKDAVVNDALQIENAAKLYCSTTTDSAVCDSNGVVNLQAGGAGAATEIASFIDGVDFTTDYTFAAVQRGSDGEWYVYLEDDDYYYGNADIDAVADINDDINDTAGNGLEGVVPSSGVGRSVVVTK